MEAEATEERVVELRLAGEQPEPASDSGIAEPRRRPISRRTLISSGVALAVLLGGVAWITAAPSAESTDDAYIAADSTSVAPKVHGLVSAVLVRDNQTVHVGDPLVRIDPEEFDARVKGAEADLADAEADVASARAALVSLNAEERLGRANVTAAGTSIRSANAEVDRAEADRRRFDALVATGAVAKRDADTNRATAVTAQQAAAHASALLAVAESDRDVITAKRPGLEAALAKAEAQRLQKQAALDLARQDQRHAVIVAPIDGVIGNRLVRVGDYVQPGTRLLSLVPVNDLYVTANFKETQTRDMRVGQAASIEVDALGRSLKGHVDSLAPGSGSTFSFLPFEPGTGNFTKIVQRVPVRIRFDPGEADQAALRAGLSVTAKVRLSN